MLVSAYVLVKYEYFSPPLPNPQISLSSDDDPAHNGPRLLPQVGVASAGVPGTSPWAAFTSTHDLGDVRGGGIMRHQWDREQGADAPLEGAPFVQDIFPTAARRAERERSRATLRREREASERLRRSVDFRQKEKQILDSVLGLGVYDRRIRPGGINSTGESLFSDLDPLGRSFVRGAKRLTAIALIAIFGSHC